MPLLDAILWALAFGQGPAQDAEQLFNQATQSLRAGDLDAAERGFREVLAQEPKNLGALGNLGVLLSRRNRPHEAIAIYKRALLLAPREPGLELNLGLAYMKLDDHAKALPLFASVAARQHPLATQAKELKATCQVQLGQISEALPTLEALNPTPNVLYALALAHVKSGAKEKAQPVFDRLLGQLPAAQAHFLEAQVWYNTGHFDQALASLDRAAAADANTPGLERERGKTLLSLRDNDKALAAFRAAIAADPHDTEALYFLGASLIQAGAHAEGRPYLEAVAKLRPDLWGTSYYLGKAQLALGKPKEALPLLAEAARRAPNETPVLYQWARALQASGRKLEADRLFRRVSQLQRQSAAEIIVMK